MLFSKTTSSAARTNTPDPGGTLATIDPLAPKFMMLLLAIKLFRIITHHPAGHPQSTGSRGLNFFAKPWVSIQRSATAAQEWWSMMPSPRQRRLPRCLQDWGSSPRGHPQSGSRRANLNMSLMSKCWCSMCRSGRSVKQLMSVNDKSLFIGIQWSRVQGD